jgi:SAM-dependent methyltransferase
LSGAAAVAEAPAATAAAPDLDEAAVKAMSHGLLEAFDRMDDAAFSAPLGATFGLFEFGQVRSASSLVESLRARRARGAPRWSRTWGEEHVTIGQGVAVYVGEAVEHVPPEAGSPSGEMDAWNTLFWVRQANAWKVAYWQWERGGVEGARAEWNATYRTFTEKDFNVKPNRLLVDLVKGRRPGTALDVAMGQGRNAVYLASIGWKVTGVDISDLGMCIARESATKHGLLLETINADTDTWDFGTNRWDLVALVYAGGDAKTLAKVKASLKVGGIVVVEAYENTGKDEPGASIGVLRTAFATGYTLLRDEVVEDVADWGLRKTKLVRFAAEKQ